MPSLLAVMGSLSWAELIIIFFIFLLIFAPVAAVLIVLFVLHRMKNTSHESASIKNASH